MKIRALIALLAIALIAAACGNDTNIEPTVTGDAPSESDEAMEDEESDEAMEDEAMEDEESDEAMEDEAMEDEESGACLLYTSPSPRDATLSRMPSSA